MPSRVTTDESIFMIATLMALDGGNLVIAMLMAESKKVDILNMGKNREDGKLTIGALVVQDNDLLDLVQLLLLLKINKKMKSIV